MAKRKGGSGFIYASLPLDMTQTLHELEEERPGTVTALILAYMDYAQDHAKEETVPEIVPVAPEGFSLAAKQTWRRLIQIYHGARGSYLAQVEGGKKAQPGPGRPKGSKNKPRESTDTDTGSEAAEDQEEPEAPEIAEDDIRITGRGPWLPSESDAKKAFWMAALSAGCGEAARATVNAIASQVWARLNTHAGYLADNGMGGIDESETKWLVGILMPDYCDPADATKKARQAWELLDAWAKLEPPVVLDFGYLLEMFMDGDFCKDGRNQWHWKENREKAYFFPLDLLADINEKCRREAQEEEPGEEQENP